MNNLPHAMNEQQYNLIGALATLIDAVASGAPRDFLEAACKDGATAIEAATGESYDQLPGEFFTWGRTIEQLYATTLETLRAADREAAAAETERADDLHRAWRE